MQKTKVFIIFIIVKKSFKKSYATKLEYFFEKFTFYSSMFSLLWIMFQRWYKEALKLYSKAKIQG